MFKILDLKQKDTDYLHISTEKLSTWTVSLQNKTYIKQRMTENVVKQGTTVGGILFVDHFWKKENLVYHLIQLILYKEVSFEVNIKVTIEQGTFILCGKQISLTPSYDSSATFKCELH